LEEIRIDAEPKVVSEVSAEAITRYSMDAAVVFLPFRLKGNQPLDPFDQPIEQILSGLPVSALVLAAEDIELEAEPEEGKAAEIAAALDAKADAEKQAQEAQKDAEQAKKAATAIKEELAQKIETPATELEPTESKIEELQKTVKAAEKQAEKTARRSAKAKAKADEAAQAVEKLGVQTEKVEKDPPGSADSKQD
jgi:DNA repair exonuclease SbcCD ATPase subunit